MGCDCFCIMSIYSNILVVACKVDLILILLNNFKQTKFSVDFNRYR